MIAIDLSKVDENNTQGESRKKIIPGGYVCEIKGVQDCPKGYNPMKPETGDFLKIQYDITDGEFSHYYKDLEDKFGFWGGTFVRSYKPTAYSMLKAFISAIEKSNPGYTWHWAEQTLVGKKIGLVLGPDTYIGMDGSEKVKMKVVAIKTVQDIQSGNYKKPDDTPAPAPVKVVDTTKTDDIETITDDVPF